MRRYLESHGIARSMSRPCNLWDDALAESFFKTLKRELVNGKGRKTREEAKGDVFKCVELCYNRRRMHSSIGYNAPCDLERDVA
ncbi:integrase core domain-containing protein [Senegalimassilia faecalis]|uniref:integrase core domain-containing protein n=1 Tax=Senegalimassilia faecalis TaxID=2509433 RepID=UPI003A97F661